MKSKKFIFFFLFLMVRCTDVGDIDDNPDNLTDTTPPTLKSFSPLDEATGVAANVSLTLTFSEAMKSATITTNTEGAECSGSVQLSSDDFVTCVRMSETSPVANKEETSFTFTPNSNLAHEATYKAKITSAVTDAAGNKIEEVSQSTGFVIVALGAPTVSSTEPADGATGVEADASLSVIFSEVMSLESITANADALGLAATGECTGSVQISCDGFKTCIIMESEFPSTDDGITHTYKPSADLSYGALCKIKVLPTVADADGTQMAKEFVHATGFIVAAQGVPTVSSISPADAATDVALDATLTVTFSEAMDAATITTNTEDTTCSGSVQVSADSYETCVQMAAAPVANDAGTAFTLTPSSPLASGTIYKAKIIVLAKNLAGTAITETNQGTGFTTVGVPTISVISPADSATGVAVNTAVAITFSEIMDADTITTNTADTACSGSIQVSSDSFSTCVQMTGGPLSSNDGVTFTVTPSGDLAVETIYKVRVTAAAKNSGAASLVEATQATGFTTAADASAPTVSSTVPADSAAGVLVSSTIAVTFSEAMSTSTITTNTDDTACDGTIQVSAVADNFATNTCVKMAAAPVASNTNKTFTLTPSSDLARGTVYKIKVTTGATNGTTAVTETVQGSGFTVEGSPLVSTYSPADTATGVAVNSTVAVTFNEVMDTDSITTNTADTACSGSIQVSTSANDFATNTCVQMTANDPVASNSDKTFTLTPASSFDGETVYKIRVTTAAKNLGATAMTLVTQGTGFTTADIDAPTVSSTSPADSATGVAGNTTVAVVFSEAMDTSTLTTNTDDTVCDGSFQVSSDSFSTCIQMTANDPVATNSDKTFTVTPASNLSSSTLYKIRIKATAADASSNTITETTQGTGFTIADTVAPTISSTTPADTATEVAGNTTVAVTFNEAMNTSSMTTGTSTICEGSIQVSSDDFSNCVAMDSATAVDTSSETVFTVTPSSNLTGGTTYKTRVTTAAEDAAGNALASDSTQASGFTTVKALYFFISDTGANGGAFSGGGARAAADALCGDSRSYDNERAIIGLQGIGLGIADMDTTYSIPDRAIYYHGTTNKIADDWDDLLDSSINQSIYTASGDTIPTAKYWTGSNTAGVGVDSCQGWGNGTSGATGNVGDPQGSDGTWLSDGTTPTCDNSLKVVCVGWNN